MDDIVSHAIEVLIGHQATDVYDTFRRLGGVGSSIPSRLYDELCWLLHDRGYEEIWVTKIGEDEGRMMWVRGPWPADFGRLDACEEVESFVPF